MTTLLAVVLVMAGAVFLLISCVGLLRFPDFYSRTHAVGKSETLGSILTLGGLALYCGWSPVALKLLLILALMAVTNPTATHALARAAWRSGLETWRANQGEGGR